MSEMGTQGNMFRIQPQGNRLILIAYTQTTFYNQIYYSKEDLDFSDWLFEECEKVVLDSTLRSARYIERELKRVLKEGVF